MLYYIILYGLLSFQEQEEQENNSWMDIRI